MEVVLADFCHTDRVEVATFPRANWLYLLSANRKCDDEASVAVHRKRRREGQEGEMERRAARVHGFVQVGELSSGRQALEGASVAPGTRETLDSLRDRRRRPPLPRDPIPREKLEHQPDNPFDLDEHKFLTNLRSAAGPSGMTTEHLRPLLDQSRDSHNLFMMAERMASRGTPISE